MVKNRGRKSVTRKSTTKKSTSRRSVKKSATRSTGLYTIVGSKVYAVRYDKDGNEVYTKDRKQHLVDPTMMYVDTKEHLAELGLIKSPKKSVKRSTAKKYTAKKSTSRKL